MADLVDICVCPSINDPRDIKEIVRKYEKLSERVAWGLLDSPDDNSASVGDDEHEWFEDGINDHPELAINQVVFPAPFHLRVPQDAGILILLSQDCSFLELLRIVHRYVKKEGLFVKEYSPCFGGLFIDEEEKDIDGVPVVSMDIFI